MNSESSDARPDGPPEYAPTISVPPCHGLSEHVARTVDANKTVPVATARLIHPKNTA